MNETWLKCKMSKGMFPDEIGVFFKATNGEDISLFCIKDFVNTQESTLLVKVVDRQEHKILVRLPVESLNGARVVPVSANDLSDSTEMQIA